VVGATDRADSYGGNVLRNLARAGFKGPVWGVNPKRDEVLGRACVPTVADLPQAVDALVVAIPAPGVADVVRAGADRGCGGAVVLSAGFAEIESGRGFQEELRAVALEHDLPICGPNGNGIVAVGARAMLWGDGLPDLAPGAIALVTQSGNVGVNALGSRRGIRWHTVVSTGNQVVCRASDWLAALAQRDDVRSVALFLESDDDGAALAEALAVCSESGVGVAVLKVGASEAGARAATAHTGALAGDQRVFRALIEEAGGAWAEDFHDLLELSRALSEPRARPRGDGGLAILTCSGGDSGVAADQAGELGLELPPLSGATSARLRELLPDAATIANPLDYTAMIWGDAPLLREIVSVVGDDEAIDQLLLLYDQPADADNSWGSVREGLIAGAHDRPAVAALVASTLPDLLDQPAALEFSAAGLPAIAGLRSALRCALALRAPQGSAARLREIATAARVRRQRSANGWLGEVEAKRLIAGAGIPVPAGGTAADLDGCVEVATGVGWPVALKLSGPALQHKAEVGALALNVGDETQMASAFGRLTALPEAAGASFLVERMAVPGIEVLVAARADGVVPALVVGLGGSWAEVLDDVAVIPLPADTHHVETALASLRGAALLADSMPAIAAVAIVTGELLLAERLSLIELNPVSVGPGGAVALDAVARA
jgi:acetyl-CoA synthetase